MRVSYDPATEISTPRSIYAAGESEEGTYLEAKAVPGGILLRPMTVVERDKAWQRVFEAMGQVVDTASKPRQTSQQQEEEIAEMVKAFRHDHAQHRP
jgi:hypothetical protein